MNVMEINACNFGSTGNIMLQIAEKARTAGHTVFTVCPDSRDNRKKQVAGQMLIGSRLSRNFHRVGAMITGREGMFSRSATAALIRQMKKREISLIHLHNLHGWYINLPMLFGYIKKNNVRVIWTLHDCWSFTGHCPHFELCGCDKWQSGCSDCLQYRDYPQSYVDNSRLIYNKKKIIFTGVRDLTIVTPSAWLAELVKKSFLKEYPVKVINNGIDLTVFKPTESDFRQKYGLEGKKIALGVSFGWGERKGLDVFCDLAARLDDSYKIVLVGTDEETDKLLPENVLSIHRTQNPKELAEIYSASDVFVNPTREDNFPTVNLEALACGTPVVTFRTGGSPECIDETCGSVVDKNDVDGMEKEIRNICENNIFAEANCVKRASLFDKEAKFEEYVSLLQLEKANKKGEK